MNSYKKLQNRSAGLFTGLIEVWRDVEHFEGCYQVSSFGRVKSLQRTRLGKNGAAVPLRERIMSLKTSKSEYKVVGLYKDGNKKHPSVHRLVANAFINRVDGKETVNHVDGNKQNNNVYNLEWATHSEQMIHAVKMELVEKRGSPKFTKVFKKEILEYSKNNPDVSIVKLAEIFNTSERTAGRIVNNGVKRRITGCSTKQGVVYKETTSNADVIVIKNMRASGCTLKEIGDKFNLGTSQVWRICKGISRNNNFEE